MSESPTDDIGHYWTNFWQQHGDASREQPDQHRVLRTLNKRPIDADTWQATSKYVLERLDLNESHDVLDLAGGNGLFANEIQHVAHSVTVVDVADSLLPQSSCKVKTICSDMRQVEFSQCSFDRILLYAAVQYLTLPETTRLMEKMYRWLKPNGILFIGDIPDAGKRWQFFDSASRRQAYFNGLAAGEPIVGTWFCRDWLSRLGDNCGFQDTAVMDQPENQIYAWFRFDFRGEK